MEESILNSIKKLLGLEADYTAFDLDVIMHINSVFFELQMLGVGPAAGFTITDDSKKWSEFIGANQIEAVKSFIWIRVKLLFDPPTSSFGIESLTKQAERMAWQLNVQQEGVRYQEWLTQQQTNS